MLLSGTVEKGALGRGFAKNPLSNLSPDNVPTETSEETVHIGTLKPDEDEN